MKNPDPNPEDEAFEELALKQGQWKYTSGWRKKQIQETGMKRDEVDIMWQQAMRESIKNNEMYTRYHFAKLVAEKTLADHAMRETQRLGQEIEQEPVALPCCGYTNASAVKWNPFNRIVQCHNCGQTYTPPKD